MENKNLEKRMYFFVNRNLSNISIGIEAGHAAMEYARNYGETKLFKDFVDNWKTWVILNGGTTNKHPDRFGTINEIYRSFQIFNAQFSDGGVKVVSFHEPDLNDALTAICFICDERVFNYKDYPDFKSVILNTEFESGTKMFFDRIKALNMSFDELKITFPEMYSHWECEIMECEKNVFLRELIKNKSLA